ncbi:hypothetical protein TNCV_1066801 [Trichonephila clavipes]|uniref:Uncharacterized protein n=1 Tax=Trichonephila clavipes TaxID=2585209 RepID=A0A8X6R8X0_TRICX|nr:hypothetical protein TNCV_1066801 [Trichonephila clavipes]
MSGLSGYKRDQIVAVCLDGATVTEIPTVLYILNGSVSNDIGHGSLVVKSVQYGIDILHQHLSQSVPNIFHEERSQELIPRASENPPSRGDQSTLDLLRIKRPVVVM